MMKITSRRKGWILLTILICNGAINLLFFEHRADYLEDYRKAKERMQVVEYDFTRQTLLLKQKLDSLSQQLIKVQCAHSGKQTRNDETRF